MDLPKLRETVRIKFWSLRTGIGQSGGVIFDMDTQVERDCYRVKTEDSWKWQIKGLNRFPVSDWYSETDQISLDEMGSELDFEFV